jgi:hypothetical protein
MVLLGPCLIIRSHWSSLMVNLTCTSLADIQMLTANIGPPGTGKTSTISEAVKIWNNNNVPVWIVAQSNVAVKNIAESLLKCEVDFKLIVSKEFYVEWCSVLHKLIAFEQLRYRSGMNIFMEKLNNIFYDRTNFPRTYMPWKG